MERAQVTAAPSKLTPEQWKRVEAALGFAYGDAQLEVDGFRVGLRVSYAGALQLAIVAYVNGEFRGKWALEDCEERRRFMREQTLRYYSPAQVRRIIAKMGKRHAQKYADECLSGTHTAYYWDWPSFRSLKRHLIKHNASIRLVAIDGLGEPEQ